MSNNNSINNNNININNNSLSNIEKISDDEFKTRFVNELNLCRKNPQKYSTKIRSYENYFEKELLKIPNSTPIKTKEGYSAFEECAMFLDNLDSLNTLTLNEGLSYSCSEGCKNLLEYTNLTEVDNLKIDENISKFGEIYGPFAQCIDFGTNNPEMLVILLLVDDGDVNRSNRLTLLNNHFKIIGFCHKNNHEIYSDVSCIMFARNFYSLNEKPIDDDEQSDNEGEENEIEEGIKYFECKLGGKKSLKKEKLSKDKKYKIIENINIKNGVLYTEIYREKINP